MSKEPFRVGRAIAIYVGCVVGAAIVGGVCAVVGVMGSGPGGPGLLLQAFGFFLGALLFGYVAGRLAQRSTVAFAFSIGGTLAVLELVELATSTSSRFFAIVLERVAFDVGGALVGAAIAALLANAMRPIEPAG